MNLPLLCDIEVKKEEAEETVRKATAELWSIEHTGKVVSAWAVWVLEARAGRDMYSILIMRWLEFIHIPSISIHVYGQENVER